MEIKIYRETEALIHAVARSIVKASQSAISQKERFNFVLSGGSSPRKLYELLASPEYQSQIDWTKTYFFFGDERFVPEHDPQRNSLMAQQTLFDKLNIEPSQIFKVDTSASPPEAAQRYFEAITTHFDHQPVKFDFILLGMGDDAHTASLFPHTEVLDDTEPGVRAVYATEGSMYRITMTAPLINQAKEIAFLVFGKDKADAVYKVLEDKRGSPKQYPARLINPENKKLVWYLDTAAASRL